MYSQSRNNFRNYIYRNSTDCFCRNPFFFNNVNTLKTPAVSILRVAAGSISLPQCGYGRHLDVCTSDRGMPDTSGEVTHPNSSSFHENMWPAMPPFPSSTKAIREMLLRPTFSHPQSMCDREDGLSYLFFGFILHSSSSLRCLTLASLQSMLLTFHFIVVYNEQKGEIGIVILDFFVLK